MIDQIIELYTLNVQNILRESEEDAGRAPGGIMRSSKGKLVEQISELIIQQAWNNTGGNLDRLKFVNKKHKIYVQKEHTETFPQEIQNEINTNQSNIYYEAGVDKHVHIDGKFVMAVECKAYTENAMLKRILVDFYLLKKLFPNLTCCLLQLETQLGGENIFPSIDSQIANRSTYTLMSYFPDVDLQIMTLLEGKRLVTKPIHELEYFKEMKPEFVESAIQGFRKLLAPLV